MSNLAEYWCYLKMIGEAADGDELTNIAAAIKSFRRRARGITADQFERLYTVGRERREKLNKAAQETEKGGDDGS